MITDLNYLKTMSGGDPAFINEMVGLFREQVEEYGILMPGLLERREWDDLSKLAHKAKSSMAVMGMTDTAELLKELEILSRSGKDEERYPGLVNIFNEHCQMALKELEQYG